MRTDVHRPSAIVPADYRFVGFEYLKTEPGEVGTILFNRERIRADMELTGGKYSRHEHGGNCHICGAHCVYTALFHHKPTNTYVRCGLECTDKLDSSIDGTEFRKRVGKGLEAVAGKRKAEALLNATGLGAGWTLYTSDTAGAGREELIVVDMVGRLVKYGSLSDNQLAFMRRLIDTIANRETVAVQRAAEREAAADLPVSEARVAIEGEVVSVRTNDFGTKMLVRHDTGWKVWGSVPSSIVGTVARGQRVRFQAVIRPSNDDAKFGFFSRPTKAEIL